jgi:hypothetical protein
VPGEGGEGHGGVFEGGARGVGGCGAGEERDVGVGVGGGVAVSGEAGVTGKTGVLVQYCQEGRGQLVMWVRKGKIQTYNILLTQVESALFLDIIIRKRATILQLLPSEDQALLVRRDTFLILNLHFDIVDRMGGLDLKRDRFPRQGLHEDLHTSTETEDEMESRLLLNIVVGESATIFELLAGKDQVLLVRRDAFLVLNLRLHVVDRVRRLDLQGDGLPCEGLLHTSAKTKEVESRLLLDVVV